METQQTANADKEISKKLKVSTCKNILAYGHQKI